METVIIIICVVVIITLSVKCIQLDLAGWIMEDYLKKCNINITRKDIEHAIVETIIKRLKR